MNHLASKPEDEPSIKPESHEEFKFRMAKRLRDSDDEVSENLETIEGFNYILNWISFIVQNEGRKKTEVALILKGTQGCGKNSQFSDQLARLLSGYCNKNVTDVDDICGEVNTGIEGNLLVVANELTNAGEGRYANFDALRSVITDDTITVNQKNIAKRIAQNVANFMFITNNSYPISISNCDRRYFVLCCNVKYAGDSKYLESLFQGGYELPNFYSHLIYEPIQFQKHNQLQTSTLPSYLCKTRYHRSRF
jgi:hypothetical protein